MTYRVPDDDTMAGAVRLLDAADHAALAFGDGGRPMVTRIALQRIGPRIVSLVSELSPHTAASRADPVCALLVAPPVGRGDPLTHPRLSVRATAAVLPRDGAEHDATRSAWLDRQPKSRLYVDFADFGFVRFHLEDAILNAGFGKAYRIDGAHLSDALA